MAILTVKNLTKKFKSATGEFVAVDNISFDLKEGEILGLLGPNGAGKTTTIQMLLGIIMPNIGSISYFGKDLEKNRGYCLQRLNFTSAFNTLQGRTSVWENLIVFANLYQVDKPEEKIKNLLLKFDMEEMANKRYHDLSSGQRTRVNIIKSLINNPQILLMDEPTASLDPDIADKTLTMIENLKKNVGQTILYTSHNMSEITRICDRVIFLDQGKIVAQDTPLGLTKHIQEAQVRLTYNEDKKIVENFLVEHQILCKFFDAHTVVIYTTEKNIPKIIFGISKAGVWITDIEVKKPTLEDVFLKIARNKYVIDKN